MNTMFFRMTDWFVLHFCASPNHWMDGRFTASDLRFERVLQKLKAYDPGFPRDDPPPELPAIPARPFPADVPVPGPQDVPPAEPIDVPPPDPGKAPNHATPPQRPKPDPKPRPIP
jgi:hypothetical protein